MKASSHLSTQIYGAEMWGGQIEKEKRREEAIGVGMRAASLKRSRRVGGRGGGRGGGGGGGRAGGEVI